MIRRFVRSKEFETPFALRLLFNTLNESFEFEKKNVVGIESTTESKMELKKTADMKSNEADFSDEDDFGSNVSASTIIFDFGGNTLETTGTGTKSETAPEGSPTEEIVKSENGTEDTGKSDFFSSDTNGSEDSCFNKGRKKKRKTESGIRAYNNKKEKSDDMEGSDKDLEKVLKLSEKKLEIGKRTLGLSLGEEKKEKVSKREENVEKKKYEEVRLIDCLDGSSENNSEEEEMLEKDIDKGFLSMVNDDMKNLFLQTTSEEEISEKEEKKVSDGGKTDVKEVKEKSQIVREKIYGKRRQKNDLQWCGISDPSTDEESEKVLRKDTGEEIEKNLTKASKITETKMLNNIKRESAKKVVTLSGSDSSDSCSDIQQVYCETSSPTKGRRNINKILKKESLQMETKQALKMETERKKRVAERQKLFEYYFPDSFQDSRLILDFDAETKKAVVVVEYGLARHLKPHQRDGVRFMWNSCFESVKRLEEDSGSGCILAHCMGLGKTLQVITLVYTILKHNTGVRTVAVFCPLNTVKNWIHEFNFWLKYCSSTLNVYDFSVCKSVDSRFGKVRRWMNKGGVMVISYEMFRGLMGKNNVQKHLYFTAFLDPGPDLVVCDEGHLLKNENSILSKCISQIKTLRRIVLTGTPLQNNLIEYYCMVQFVKPNILGTRKEFMNRFVNPINNGQFEDSTELDVRIMKRRAHVLHTMLEGFIQRFSYHVLTPFLPEKQEYVISVSLTETQSNLYRFFINSCSREGRMLFKDFNWLRKAWTHPRVLFTYSEKSCQSDSKSEESEDKTKARWGRFVPEEEYERLESAGKLVLLFHILKRCKAIGDKVLVFSQSLASLDLIQHFLKKAHSDFHEGRCNQFADNWELGLDYFRMDGSTSSEHRDTYCQKFNNSKDERSRLFLISTKAGGLGINLVAANRVVVFDASWNPSHDVQCIFRVYRFGQTKPCYIYRFLASATMEEKIYKRQVTKLSLAHRILDQHQIERHYSMGNLQELYTYQPVPKSEWKIPKLPKDNLFAEVLMLNKNIIVGFHEHDSLLENKEDEELSEEERRVAWEEYEKEKILPKQPQFPTPDNTISRLPYTERVNAEAVHAVHNYKAITSRNVDPRPLVFNNNQNQMCRIVSVRTLRGDLGERNQNIQMDQEKLLEAGQSLGMNPLQGEDVDKFCTRIRRMMQEILPWNT